MENTQIILAGIWIAVMFTYCLGDILRIYSGDFEKMKKEDKSWAGIQKHSQVAFLGMAALMVIPIMMIVLTLLVDHDINRWLNIVVAGIFFLFNLVGLPTYPGWYDRFLLGVSLVFNIMSVYYAWGW